jgi:hypothetical protein
MIAREMTGIYKDQESCHYEACQDCLYYIGVLYCKEADEKFLKQEQCILKILLDAETQE